MLHIIPQRDFNFVEAELRRITGELPALEPSESDPVEISTTTAVVSHVTTPTVTAGSSTYAEQRGSKKLFDRPRKGRAKVKRQRRSRRLAISHKPRLF
jgi:hypothetical protein